MHRLRRAGVCLIAALAAAPAFAAQPADPRSGFVDALGAFSLALDGTRGDEDRTIAAALEAMQRALDDWDATIRTYERGMAADIGAADPQLAARMRVALAAVYLGRHRTADAVGELRAAIALDPARAEAHALLGSAYSQILNDLPAAITAFRNAAARDPDNRVRAYVLARHLLKAGDAEEAARILQRVQDSPLSPAAAAGAPNPAPFATLALVPEKADVEPFFPPVRYIDGFMRLQRGDYGAALETFREAAAGDPLMADAGPHREPLRRAAAALRDGAVDSAIEQLTTAIQLAPDRAEPRRLLGHAHALAARHAEAADAFAHAIRLAPGDERARLGLADALVALGRLDEAEEALRATLAALPASGRARYALGRVYQRQGKHGEALRELDLAAAARPLLGLNGLYDTIGSLHAAQQNFDAAIAAHSARVDLHPNDPEAHYELGDMYLRQGRHDEALAEFSIVLLIDPQHARAAAAVAQTHLRTGAYEIAAEAAGRALAIDPTHTEARYVLGTALIRLGQTEEGRRELEIFQARQAELAAARSRAIEIEGLRRDATISAADGDHARTVALLRKVLALETSEASHFELGLALLDAGAPAEAIEHFNAAARLNAPYHVHRYLAEAYGALGRVEDSRREQASYERIHREALRRRGAGR